jgi:hypothetical protein
MEREYVQRYRKVCSLALCICVQRYNVGKEKKVKKVKKGEEGKGKEKKEEKGTEKTKSDKNKESNFKHRPAM